MMIWNLLMGACGMFILMSDTRAQYLPESPVPPDSEIRRILVDRIDGARQGVGMVVGVIEPKGTRVVAYGSLDKGDKRPLDGNTIFAIGSVTKVFTSLLLADMVQRGEVALADPVAKYLPQGVKVPERGGRRITLEDLSTHTSGLPRLPSNWKPANPANPYADYTAERLYEFLSTYKLWRDIGSGFEYSNVGAGLLGHALARRAGMDYEALVRSRIAQPLHLTCTRITLSPEMKARLAVGHNTSLAPVPNWDFQALAGCGALRSSVNDLLVFLAANLGYSESPLAPAMAAMLKVRRPTTITGTEMALGWVVAGDRIVWHNGSTAGYRSFIGYDPKSRAGVVVLSNTFTIIGINDIGMHLLDARNPLANPKAPTGQ
jgi:serine-type D-Ala-D-Ala carboxypeptidase/endopeptidase